MYNVTARACVFDTGKSIANLSHILSCLSIFQCVMKKDMFTPTAMTVTNEQQY